MKAMPLPPSHLREKTTMSLNDLDSRKSRLSDAQRAALALRLRGASGASGAPAASDAGGAGGLPDGDTRNTAHTIRSEEHTSELQSQSNLVCRLLLEKKKNREDSM